MDSPSAERGLVPLPDQPNAKDADGLTHRQRELIRLMVESNLPLAAAAPLAGYSDPSGAYQAWKLEHVQAAFHKAATIALRDDIPLALEARRKLLNAKSELVKLQAAQDVLDRAGLLPPKGQGVSVGSVNIQINLGD